MANSGTAEPALKDNVPDGVVDPPALGLMTKDTSYCVTEVELGAVEFELTVTEVEPVVVVVFVTFDDVEVEVLFSVEIVAEFEVLFVVGAFTPFRFKGYWYGLKDE